MGIRISKSIGYFADKEQVEELFKPNYEEILENLDYEETAAKEFKEKVLYNIKHHKTLSNAPDAEMVSLILNIYAKEKKWEPLSLIRQIYNLDDYHGFLFLTPCLLKKHRHDNDIDYYENDSSKCQFIKNILNCPIYPVTGFLYKGKIEEYYPEVLKNAAVYFEEENIVSGSVVDSHLLSVIMYLIYNKRFDDNSYYKAIKDTNIFHPNVDPLAYIIAKSSGILKDEINEITFRTTVEPAIITTWG